MAARAGYKMYRNRQRNNVSRRSKAPKETAFLTYDNDFKTDYRYKRMPRRKRRAWKKFSKKVNAVINKSQGLKKHLYEHVSQDSATIGSTYYGSAMLYTPDARVVDLNADMGTFFREIFPAGVFDNITNFGAADAQKVIRFESAQLEVTWRNIGVNPLIIDLYYVRCRKDYGLTNVDFLNNPQGMYVLGFDKQGKVVDVEQNTTPFNAGQTATQFGTTPFQSPLFAGPLIQVINVLVYVSVIKLMATFGSSTVFQAWVLSFQFTRQPLFLLLLLPRNMLIIYLYQARTKLLADLHNKLLFFSFCSAKRVRCRLLGRAVRGLG